MVIAVTGQNTIDSRILLGVKADFHSVQFSERAQFCDRFPLECIQSAISNGIRSTWQHTFQKKAIAQNRALAKLHWMEISLKEFRYVKTYSYTLFNSNLGLFSDWSQLQYTHPTFYYLQSVDFERGKSEHSGKKRSTGEPPLPWKTTREAPPVCPK